LKNAILKGTILLTVTGLITRVLGFYYRICLADALGAEFLGIYQLVFPVYGICYTLYASGIQTAVSKLVAEENSRGNVSLTSCLMRRSMLLSFGIALALSVLVYFSATPCAHYFLMEPRATDSLRILSLAFPFCAITACINGYYIGCKETAVPAFTQLLEQVVRIAFVLYLVTLPPFSNEESRCLAAVIGLVLGETASTLFNCIAYRNHRTKRLRHANACDTDGLTKRLLALSVPLSLNRLIINLLHSIESVFIPGMLRLSGLSVSEALSQYGILNGMAIPFILFPSAIPNALSVLLLPAVSENLDEKNKNRLEHCVKNAVKYSLIIGFFSTAVFFYFGRDIGYAVFHNTSAGSYIRTLSLLCPLLYLSTALGSVLNGLGKPLQSFFTSVSGLLVRLLILVCLVPKTGIYGILVGLLVSQLISTLLDIFFVLKHCNAFPPVSEWLVFPALYAFLPAQCFVLLYRFLQTITSVSNLLLLFLIIVLLCFVYATFLYLFKVIRKEDWRE